MNCSGITHFQITRSGVVTFLLSLLAITFSSMAAAEPEAGWSEALAAEIAEIDEAMPGQLGVYIRRFSDGESGEVVRHRTDRDWYLASTIKIPLAIALMQKVEAGELSLDDELELAESDFVDGAGDLLWQEPGSRYTLDELNTRSIRDSDSTATDMLIRLLSEDGLNQQIREAMVSEGFGPVTTIVQVRFDAFGEIHPDVENLTNLDFIELRSAGGVEQRYQHLLEKLQIDKSEAKVQSAHEAFERYYARGINAGSLEAFGRMLERLVQGELLNEAHTSRLLDIMESVNTGDRRIKAGLPDGAGFAHKTGTQIARACNVGIINPRDEEQAVVVAACAEGYGELSEAERAFAAVGEALTRAGLVVTP